MEPIREELVQKVINAVSYRFIDQLNVGDNLSIAS